MELVFVSHDRALPTITARSASPLGITTTVSKLPLRYFNVCCFPTKINATREFIYQDDVCCWRIKRIAIVGKTMRLRRRKSLVRAHKNCYLNHKIPCRYVSVPREEDNAQRGREKPGSPTICAVHEAARLSYDRRKSARE